ncbi:acetyltransferase [Xanthomonas oryzae pv. oryzae]|uniref:Acetyltransferase n=1 Tax=Xanthomonas oryzae pv. oryzae (strain KACC10331 / KXO85) TaxID=291331 RepID=Q5H6C3_XANOR|nr:acetyltransferase [Xanthomonas oryzae pv. oryzae KACC 10331]AOS00860.1 acetyltransferase [Xanthomonas oryzae pv. oryzae]AOS17473.1 acetyltransferase [Xanthomonas oryzae pv. oryzae]AOS21619.1 acetyltransferase [Xanthomonas oryzae pv. oryzae]AOS25788.1 acetyltransferase [Xanthomonas oryzae pv. oryzae]
MRDGFAHRAVQTREDAAFIGTLGLLYRETLLVPHIGHLMTLR